MILFAVNDARGFDGSELELGRDFSHTTAYEFIAKNDTDFDNPKWPDCDLVLVDGDEKWVFEAGAWFNYIA